MSLWDQHGSRVIRGNLIILPLNGNQLVAIEPVYIEAEQTKIPTLARVVFGQLLPDDRKIEWAGTLSEAEALLVGIRAEQPAGPRSGGNRSRSDSNVLAPCFAICGRNTPRAISSAMASCCNNSKRSWCLPETVWELTSPG